MDWATIFVVFVIIFSIFSTSHQDPQKTFLEKPTKFRQARMLSQNVDASMTGQIPSYDATNLNTYQIITSYIMDNFSTVPIGDVLTIAENIIVYSNIYNLDPLLMTSLIAVESEFNRCAVSPSGAKGLGQLMDFNLQCYKVSDPFDIEQNIRATCTMMRELLDTWKGDVQYSLASYFEGVNAIIRKKDSPFSEKTTRYVYKVMSRYEVLKQYK
ncbi:MAG: lytic transglycosylase domain-containing protein [Candidatus Margulisbacteria bacterium]|nr:lytic transglycosylase domain-containing protein [Candidatus Margulisiibacteriota bacterium]